MIAFNDTTTLRGLVQLFEQEIGANVGDVSGNTVRLKRFTASVNNAIDRYFSIAIQASGTWQLDDTNHTDYPFIETDLIALQRDYTFTVDQSSNQILDIYKVMVKDEQGVYYEVFPVDQQSDEYTDGFWSEQNQTGRPMRYDKTGNGIFFDVLPNYNWRTVQEGEKGVKIFINRESSYVAYTDTTKKIGYPYHQEYFYLKPASEYARIKGLASKNDLANEILKLEGDTVSGRVGLIAKAYGNRAKDETQTLRAETINSI